MKSLIKKLTGINLIAASKLPRGFYLQELDSYSNQLEFLVVSPDAITIKYKKPRSSKFITETFLSPSTQVVYMMGNAGTENAAIGLAREGQETLETEGEVVDSDTPGFVAIASENGVYMHNSNLTTLKFESKSSDIHAAVEVEDDKKNRKTKKSGD